MRAVIVSLVGTALIFALIIALSHGNNERARYETTIRWGAQS